MAEGEGVAALVTFEHVMQLSSSLQSSLQKRHPSTPYGEHPTPSADAQHISSSYTIRYCRARSPSDGTMSEQHSSPSPSQQLVRTDDDTNATPVDTAKAARTANFITSAIPDRQLHRGDNRSLSSGYTDRQKFRLSW